MTGPRAVVQLRAAPPLTDIAGQLRQLADWIERGAEVAGVDHGVVRGAYVVLDTDQQFRPIFHAFGEVKDRHGIAGLFTHCAQLALTDREG